MAAAHGGQIVLSRASADQARDALPNGFGLLDLGDHRLRGLSGPERIYQLTIPGLPAQFPPLQSLDAFPDSLRLGEPSFARLDELAGRETRSGASNARGRKPPTGLQVAPRGANLDRQRGSPPDRAGGQKRRCRALRRGAKAIVRTNRL